MGPSSNTRGEMLEEIIGEYNLFVENVGEKATFKARGTETNIDVTLSMNWGEVDSGWVSSWRVADEATLSDHCLIKFKIKGIEMGNVKFIPNLKKTNWKEVRKISEAASGISYKGEFSPEWLDREYESICSMLNRVVKENSPKKQWPPKPRKPTFWNEGLIEDRKEVRSKYKKYLDNPTEENWGQYRDCRAGLKRSIKL